jgi:hypothetical protein
MGEKNMSYGFNENFEFLINELSEAQKLQSKTTTDLVNSVNILTVKFNKIEEYLANREKTTPTIDTNPFKEMLKKAIVEIKLMLPSQTKNSSKKIQILLFPEQDAKLFYKIVFGRWFLMILIALFLKLAYQVITQAQQNNMQIEIEEKKSEPVIKAWEYLYNQSNNKFRRQMDTALIKAVKKENEADLTNK